MSIEQPPSSKPWQTPKVDKSLPRPAPTRAYSWREYNPRARLVYTRDHRQANEELSKLDVSLLGFDLEWKPIYYRGARENPVALVQLASYDTILLMQISAMKDFPSKLAEVLANADIVKAGVGIHNDALKLYNDYRVPISNCVDLSLLARTVDNARWQGMYHHPLGLARLIESYEYRILVKGKITRSNWEALLSEMQQEYASNDAHAGFTLYRKFATLLPLLPTPPDREWYSFDLVDGQLCKQDGTQWQAENPNYDPGPLPPPKLPKEVKASMIITEANGDSSNNNENRFQRRKGRKNSKPDQTHLPLSTSQQSSAVASGSTQQLRPQGQRSYEYNPQYFPGQIISQHRPTGAHAGSSAQCRLGTSSNIRNDRGQSTEQTDRGYPKHPRRRPRHPASPTANHS